MDGWRNRQTDEYMNKQSNRQIDITDKLVDIHANKHMDK